MNKTPMEIEPRCGHLIRSQILTFLREGCIRYCSLSERLEGESSSFNWVPADAEEREKLKSDAGYVILADAEGAIERAASQCRPCMWKTAQKLHVQRKMAKKVEEEDQETDRSESEGTKMPENSGFHPKALPSHYKDHGFVRNFRNRALMPPRVVNSKNTSLPLPLSSFCPIHDSEVADFDDFFSGPNLDDLFVQICSGPGALWNPQPTKLSVWAYWIDYGYRYSVRSDEWTDHC